MSDKHQDYIYINEDYYKNPKESFTFLSNKISQQYSNPTVLDLGCARGEFLYYLKNNINYKKLSGIDYSEQLINEAKSFQGLNDVELHVGSADDFHLNEKFDVIIMSGVLSYFDDIEKIFKLLKSHLSENGTILLFGLFNEYDVDILIKYRNNKYFNSFESGWNIHSIKTIQTILNKFNLKLISQDKFNLSFALEPQDDPCRSWHINTENGKKFTNGLNLIYDILLLEIKEQI